MAVLGFLILGKDSLYMSRILFVTSILCIVASYMDFYQ